jgi:uncharacterized protein (UPF0333 family)
MSTTATNRNRQGQSILEYIVVLLAITMAVSWAAAPVQNRMTKYAEAIESMMRYLF